MISTLALLAVGVGGSASAATAPTDWTPLTATGWPTGGFPPAMTFDDATGQLLAYDGATWSWDGRSWTQVGLDGSLPPRDGAAMAFDGATNQLVLFGGLGPATGPNPTAQTWTWNGARWMQQHPTTVPAPVWHACAGYDAASGQLIMLGGIEAGTAAATSHNETWSWTGSNWVRLRPSTSPLGGECSMAYDPDLQALVLATRSPNAVGVLQAEIWLWDGSTWTQAHSGLPDQAGLPSLAYDPEAGGLIAYTAVCGVDTDINQFIWCGYENETWLWDGNAWSMLAVTSLQTKNSLFGNAIAFDAATHQLLLSAGRRGVWGSAVGSVVSPSRVFGADRQSTAVAASMSAFPLVGSASAVVLARADGFADALAGGPLAAGKHAPLLLTSSGSLDEVTKTEIQRVLKPGGTVYLLGGDAALSTTVASSVTALGDAPVRLSGADRFGTALAVANAMGNPSTVFEASGATFADALSAVPAAVAKQGVILLTDGSTVSPATATYLRAHPGLHYTVGGPAAAADPSAIALLGVDRYATSAAVARAIFPAAKGVSLASGINFPDALATGSVAGAAGEPVLLVPADGLLPAPISAYLATRGGLTVSARVFGGPSAVSDTVLEQIPRALAGS